MVKATKAVRDAYWTQRVICKPAVEQNGLLDDAKSVPPASTRKQLADWLNVLARTIHIERTPENPHGYLATEDNIG